MAYRDSDWFKNALYQARCRIRDLQARIARHIESDEFDAAKLLLPDLSDALSNANKIANQFADKVFDC